MTPKSNRKLIIYEQANKESGTNCLHCAYCGRQFGQRCGKLGDYIDGACSKRVYFCHQDCVRQFAKSQNAHLCVHLCATSIDDFSLRF